MDSEKKSMLKDALILFAITLVAGRDVSGPAGRLYGRGLRLHAAAGLCL